MSRKCRKHSHTDFGEALKVMQHLNRHEGYDIKRAYWCNHCKSWHLTSQEYKN